MTPQAHLIATIDDSFVATDPFPHIITPGIFDQDTFAKILLHFPTPDNMSVYTQYRRWVYVHGHDPQKKYRRIADLLGWSGKTFWTEVGQWLSSDAVKESIFAKFNLDPNLSTFTTIRCMTDIQGYHITRHPDSTNKVISMLLFTPDNRDHPEWGTSIEGGKKVPFVPNQMFAFAKTKESWHWVDPITTKGAVRNQILVVYERSS